MTRRFAEKRLVIASHNPGKVREIADLLFPFSVEVTPATELGLAEPEETGTTFAENAVLKAHAAMLACGLPALADDSGLAVEALDGRPGIHSARWAGEELDFTAAMARLEQELEGIPDNHARLSAPWPWPGPQKKAKGGGVRNVPGNSGFRRYGGGNPGVSAARP